MIKIRVAKIQKYSYSNIFLSYKISKDRNLMFDITNECYAFILKNYLYSKDNPVISKSIIKYIYND